MENFKYLSAQEIARRYNITSRAVTKACREGRIDARKVGIGKGMWIVNIASAEAYWRERRVKDNVG